MLWHRDASTFKGQKCWTCVVLSCFVVFDTFDNLKLWPGPELADMPCMQADILDHRQEQIKAEEVKLRTMAQQIEKLEAVSAFIALGILSASVLDALGSHRKWGNMACTWAVPQYLPRCGPVGPHCCA